MHVTAIGALPQGRSDEGLAGTPYDYGCCGIGIGGRTGVATRFSLSVAVSEQSPSEQPQLTGVFAAIALFHPPQNFVFCEGVHARKGAT